MTAVFYVRYDPRTEEVLDVISYLEIGELVVEELQALSGIVTQNIDVQTEAIIQDLTVLGSTEMTEVAITDILYVDTLAKVDTEDEIAVQSNMVFDDNTTLRVFNLQIDQEVWLPPRVDGNEDEVTEFYGEFDHQESIWVGLPDITPTVSITPRVIADSVYLLAADSPTVVLDFIKFKVNGQSWTRVFFHDFNSAQKLANAAALTFVGFVLDIVTPAGYLPLHIQSGFTTICEIYRPPIVGVGGSPLAYTGPQNQAEGQTFLTHVKLNAGGPGIIQIQVIGANATSTRPVGSFFKIPDFEFSYRNA